MSEPVQILSPARTEPRDVSFRHVAAGLSFLALGLAVVLLGAIWLFPDTATDQYVAEPLPKFADPQLQPSPRADMERFAAEQRRQLEGVYWIDQSRGIVHLPIDDAMRKLAAEGVPDWPGPKGPATP